jgi:guanyl-specific ribonuclease Sa
MFSPRSRTLTVDIIWSLGAAIAAVTAATVIQGSWPFTSAATTDAQTVAEWSQIPEFASLTPIESPVDADQIVDDNLPFTAAAPHDPTLDAKDAADADEASSDSSAAASAQTTAPSGTTPSAPSTTTAPAPSTSDSSAQRPPASPTPAPEPTRQERVETIADRLPFNWRAAGVTLKAQCAPNRSHCQWGLYTVADNTIWVGTDAFSSNARLFYVVAHEMVHAWQFANDPHARMNDLADWGRTGVDGLEAAADCLAQAWGATMSHYWNCPSDAQSHMAQIFART